MDRDGAQGQGAGGRRAVLRLQQAGLTVDRDLFLLLRRWWTGVPGGGGRVLLLREFGERLRRRRGENPRERAACEDARASAGTLGRDQLVDDLVVIRW